MGIPVHEYAGFFVYQLGHRSLCHLTTTYAENILYIMVMHLLWLDDTSRRGGVSQRYICNVLYFSIMSVILS